MLWQVILKIVCSNVIIRKDESEEVIWEVEKNSLILRWRCLPVRGTSTANVSWAEQGKQRVVEGEVWQCQIPGDRNSHFLPSEMGICYNILRRGGLGSNIHSYCTKGSVEMTISSRQKGLNYIRRNLVRQSLEDRTAV